MNLIGILGIVALMGIAWAMSFHKTKVKLRTVLGGLGLQFVFALIVLKDNYWSFVGMGALALLISAFILENKAKQWGEGKMGLGISIALGLVVGGLIYGIGYALGAYATAVLGWALGILLLLIIVNAVLKLASSVQSYLGVVLVLVGVVLLMVNGWYGKIIFAKFSEGVSSFLSLSDYGSQFIFGNLADSRNFGPWMDDFPNKGTWPGFGFQFAFKVLPTIIFFGGFIAVLYYLGMMQIVIEGLSKFMRWTIGTSGAETLSCSANIFVGQTEAPLLIKPFLDKMTQSELLTIMVGGFATIAGGVLAGYIAMGIDAGHLIAASVMAAPGALVVGKLLFPETEHSSTGGDVKLPKIDTGNNVIEAATNGITDGLKLAANVGAMLIGFIALIALVDLILNKADLLVDGMWLAADYEKYADPGFSPVVGEYRGYFPGSLRTLFGTILSPIAFLMGVPWKDASEIGNMIGIKLSLNEFVAYGTLQSAIKAGTLDPRSVIIATYALCGFANFSSIGIQIGGISAIAPKRKSDLARVGLKAMFGGAIVTMLNGTIAGLLV